ncbi:MAG: hypothetical protein ACJ76F_11985 [Bacteroidia bacterium]
MDISRVTGFKRIKFSANDHFCFRLKNSRKKYCGTIEGLGDSLIVFKGRTVGIDEIAMVYRDRSNFVTRGLSTFFIGLGIGFVSLDSFNNFINNERPIVKQQALIESASFLAAGLLLKKLGLKRYRIGKRRSLRILDISP